MKLIFILLIVYLAYSVLRSVAKKSRASGAAQCGRGVEHGRGQASGRSTKSANADEGKSVQTDPGEEMMLDPVCSSYVPLSVAVKKGTGANTVYFCSKECMEKHGA
jgi:YHS domain-containing protein